MNWQTKGPQREGCGVSSTLKFEILLGKSRLVSDLFLGRSDDVTIRFAAAMILRLNGGASIVATGRVRDGPYELN